MESRVDAAERRRLRWRLSLFLVAVAVPSALLLFKALDQLKWEALRQTQLAAEALTLGIDERLDTLIRAQDARSFADFAFLTLAGDPSAGFLQRSALSTFPVDAAVPGLIGWFQIDAAGRLSTPLLPSAGVDAASYGISAAELAGRQQLEQRIAAILGSNALVSQSMGLEPASAPMPKPGSEPDSEPDAELEPETDLDRVSEDMSSARKAVSDTPNQAIFERLSPTRNGPPGAGLAARERPLTHGFSETAPSRDLVDEALSVRQRAEATSGRGDLEQRSEPERSPRRERAVLPAVLPEEVAIDSPRAADAPVPASPLPKWGKPESSGRIADKAATSGEEVSAEEASVVAVPRPDAEAGRQKAPEPLFRAFDSELDPFRFSLLDSGHFVLFRWAWRNAARHVQGALIDADSFLSVLIGDAFRASTVQRAASLRVNWDELPLRSFGSRTNRYDLSPAGTLPQGTVVYRVRLREPFGGLGLEFDAARMPRPPGASFVHWLGLILALVLITGTWALYRLGLRQLGLVRQQQDFVAAVSHELKTPLTSIRMYSEMLCQGWVSDDKRGRYYRYIQDESERLSRLVANVLQLARMSRDELKVEARSVALSEVMDQARPTLASQAEQAGIELVIDCGGTVVVSADPDALTQILINLVDNAIKFSSKARLKRIEIRCVDAPDALPWISVRDHGPGIPKTERKRVFDLFHRLENESTRESKGTGIGLALVKRLVQAMGAEVELIGRDPGIEVRLRVARANDGR
ncbi:MAG: ATP-binding protein [Thiohalocapsa sp.]